MDSEPPPAQRDLYYDWGRVELFDHIEAFSMAHWKFGQEWYIPFSPSSIKPIELVLALALESKWFTEALYVFSV